MFSSLTKIFPAKSPLIMGVINLTPDSFSDGGKFASSDEALSAVEEMTAADIIDIGGESTGPGRAPVSGAEEILRIEALINVLPRKRFISVDTYKAETAAFALERGVQMINDVSALRADANLASVIREHQAFVVLMYSKEADNKPHATRQAREYEDIIREIGDFLALRVDYALRNAIPPEKIILDPGMGAFLSPNHEYSWAVLRELPRLKERFSEFPLLIGTSRKGFLGGPMEGRDPLSQLTALGARLNGADIIRTHRPEMMAEFLSAWELIQPQSKS